MEITGVYCKNRMKQKYTALGRIQTSIVSGSPRVGSGPLQQQKIRPPPHQARADRLKIFTLQLSCSMIWD